MVLTEAEKLEVRVRPSSRSPLLPTAPAPDLLQLPAERLNREISRRTDVVDFPIEPPQSGSSAWFLHEQPDG